MDEEAQMNAVTARQAFELGVTTSLWLMSGVAATGAPALTLGEPRDRPDRLIAISGNRPGELVVEYSSDGGQTWCPATVYVGATIDEWRACDHVRWNQATVGGRIPAGEQDCLWNHFFDVAMPADGADLRIREPGAGVVLRQRVDLTAAHDVFVIDHRNVAALAGGELPAPWTLKPGTRKTPATDSAFCPVADPSAPALVLKPTLKG